MASTNEGKAQICAWIRETFPPESEILDVGACDGKWRNLLPEYPNIDAVEAFKPNADGLAGYRNIVNADIYDLKYADYDLIIFGDVIEHMTVERAQKVLAYAREHCTDMVIGVPWLYQQGAIYGNPFEIHRQDDLTEGLFNERYPGYEPLYVSKRYGYYHKGVTK